MNTTLYCFSATGNSLAVTRELQKRLDPCNVVSIPRVLFPGNGSDTAEEDTAISGSVIGIVSPIYMHNMPHLVARFLQRITDVEYLFFVFTGGGELGKGAAKARSLCTGNGLTLSALFNVPMPSNYTPYGYPDGSSQKELFSASHSAVDRIAETVQGRTTHFDAPGTGFLGTHIFPGPLYQIGYRFIPRMDGSFSVDDTCTHCGICSQVCPVGNISLEEGVPQWHHQCEQCYACLQWCPVDAIQYGRRTRGVKRYHHPEVKLQEIIAMARDKDR